MGRLGWIAAFICVSGASFAAEATETLIVPPYPAQVPWQQIRTERKGPIESIEWRPPSQEEGRGKDALQETIVHDTKTSPSQHIITMEFRYLPLMCSGGARINGPIERIEGGYTVAYAQSYCSNQAGTSEDVDRFTKVVRGRDNLYIVTRSFRRPMEHSPTPGVRHFSNQDAAQQALDEQAAANNFLSQIRLCPSAESCAVPASWPVDGKTPQSEVREKLGAPSSENRNPDGRHIDFYEGSDGLIRTYLYGKDDVLIGLSVHAVPQQ